MTVDTSERIAFLKKIHLFHGLDDEQLTAVAGELEEQAYASQEVIVRQDMEADRFFLIYSGRVDVTAQKGGRPQLLATLVTGDYFGEEALLHHSRRTATVKSQDEILLLSLDRHAFNRLLKQVPRLRINFEVAVKSRQMVRRVRFKWVQPGEVIYFLARKHPIAFVLSLTGPLFALILPLGLLVFYLLTATAPLLWAAGITFLVLLGWVGWNWLDWSNDYYIVTNRRVIWLEKVIGVYDSRQEAPLTTILSVGVETDLTGRMLDYGNVIVRTFVGRIPFHHVNHPYQAASLIEEHWIRSRESSNKSDFDSMKQAIRGKLGLATPKVAEPEKTQAAAPSVHKPGIFRILFSSLFKTRYEESGGTITYRKHRFVLLLQTWKPAFLWICLLLFLIFHWRQVGLGLDTFAIVLWFFLFLVSLWWLYQYVDWSNDKFQVTSEQIVDIDRRPLGSEERRSAPLDNILSTEYTREGFLQVVLNYGNVYITVGGTQLIFENVEDPTSVQQDIDQRRIARMARKKQAEAVEERERMAEWIATYHRSKEEFLREQELSAPPDLPELDEEDDVQ